MKGIGIVSSESFKAVLRCQYSNRPADGSRARHLKICSRVRQVSNGKTESETRYFTIKHSFGFTFYSVYVILLGTQFSHFCKLVRRLRVTSEVKLYLLNW